jgi:hypothetical protein
MLLIVLATAPTVTPPLNTPIKDYLIPIFNLPNMALLIYVHITLAVKAK